MKGQQNTQDKDQKETLNGYFFPNFWISLVNSDLHGSKTFSSALL